MWGGVWPQEQDVLTTLYICIGITSYTGPSDHHYASKSEFKILAGSRENKFAIL